MPSSGIVGSSHPIDELAERQEAMRQLSAAMQLAVEKLSKADRDVLFGGTEPSAAARRRIAASLGTDEDGLSEVRSFVCEWLEAIGRRGEAYR